MSELSLTSCVPSPLELKEGLPLREEIALQIQEHRQTVQKLISGQEERLALVIGPCSLHNIDSALHYAKKVQTLQAAVSSTCFLVMRAYIEKPRTCLGWKGMLYDPLLQGQENLIEGLFSTRLLLLNLVKLGIPLATEFLDPLASAYFYDLISWGFIGARTAASSIHRQMASFLPMPIGFKNSVDGNVEDAIYGAIAARQSHSFLQPNEEGKIAITKSQGNPFCHVVLRGSRTKTNYDKISVENALALSERHQLSARLLIDCSHGNCQRQPKRQIPPLESLVEQYLKGNKNILGGMLESHLEEGSQPFPSPFLSPSLSVTDPCLGWQATEELILRVHEALLEG